MVAGYRLKSGFLILLHEPGIFVKIVKAMVPLLMPLVLHSSGYFMKYSGQRPYQPVDTAAVGQNPRRGELRSIV
jgi:hypothetical protein